MYDQKELHTPPYNLLITTENKLNLMSWLQYIPSSNTFSLEKREAASLYWKAKIFMNYSLKIVSRYFCSLLLKRFVLMLIVHILLGRVVFHHCKLSWYIEKHRLHHLMAFIYSTEKFAFFKAKHYPTISFWYGETSQPKILIKDDKNDQSNTISELVLQKKCNILTLQGNTYL